MLKILVLDDEESLRSVLQDVFTEAGYDVVVADSGDAGLALFKDQPTDLVITDLIMPGKEGIETIRELRALFPDVKIIAISGRGGPYVNANLGRALDVGANLAVAKPFGPDQILKMVVQLFPDSAKPAN